MIDMTGRCNPVSWKEKIFFFWIWLCFHRDCVMFIALVYQACGSSTANEVS